MQPFVYMCFRYGLDNRAAFLTAESSGVVPIISSGVLDELGPHGAGQLNLKAADRKHSSVVVGIIAH